MDKKRIETLRSQLLAVESKIKEIVGRNPFDFYCLDRKLSETKRKKIDNLLFKRNNILCEMFDFDEEEVEHIIQVNNILITLRRQMHERAANLYRTVLRSGVDTEFDDDYEVEGTLSVDVDYDPDEDYGNVLHLSNDDYYGSDFSYMIFVIIWNREYPIDKKSQIDDCCFSHDENNTPETSDKELGCDYTFLMDGQTWLHSPIGKSERFKDIVFEYGFHCLYHHVYFSMPDIARLNSFWVEAKIRCQRITDQRGQRYREIKKEMELRAT